MRKDRHDWMDARERKLLEHALDALDRLFDRDCAPIDIWSLFYATAEALRDTRHFQEFEGPVAELRAIVQQELTPGERRDRALIATDGVRRYLAQVTRLD